MLFNLFHQVDICTDSAKAMVGRTTDTLVLIRAGAPNYIK